MTWILELHPELVFFGRYWSVFLGMYDTITEGNLGQYVCSRGTYVGMTPFLKCPELQLGSRGKNKTHPGGKAAWYNTNWLCKQETCQGRKPSWRSITEPSYSMGAHAVTRAVGGRAQLTGEKEKKPSFSRASKQNKQNIRIRHAQCFPLSTWAPGKRQRVPTFSRAPTFSGEGAQSLGTKDKMRVWWAHNNQKRKVPRKWWRGPSQERVPFSQHILQRMHASSEEHSITGRQERKEHTTTNSLLSFFFIFISQKIKPFQFIMLPTLCTDASPSLLLSNASPFDDVHTDQKILIPVHRIPAKYHYQKYGW
jgi:hypothetical protein